MGLRPDAAAVFARSASTSFIGREGDLRALGERIAAERMVTLLGPPGVGKTRLVTEFALRRARDAGAEEALHLCDLSPATTGEDVCSAVALAIDVPLTVGRTRADSVERVAAALAMRGPVLLVLDNFEQVARFADETLGAWLRLAPELRSIVTSRERLGVPGEVLFDVGPLPLPEGDAVASEAVELFVERARAVRRGFEVTVRDAAVVAELVRHLDGLPLAIELAAARMNVLGPKQLLDRLRLDVLDRAAGTHRSTLRAALDGSWQLLDQADRAALAQAAVFRGGFTLEAAEAVLDLDEASSTTSTPTAPRSTPVLDVLQSLREKSLLRSDEAAEAPGELRFSLLETVRAYAEEQLEQSGAGDGARARHADYYLAQGSTWVGGVDGPQGLECLRRLSLEAANLQEVHRRAIAASPATKETVTRALRAVLALEPLFYTRGPMPGCLAMIDAALARVPASDLERPLLAASLQSRGKAKRHVGRLADGATDLQEALEAARAAGDTTLQGRILGDIAFVRWRQGRTEEARELYEQSLSMLRAAGDRKVEGKVLGNLGIVLRELGRLEDAATAYDDALRIHEEVQNRRSASIVLASRGELLRAQGRLEEGRESFARALAIHAEFGDRYAEGSAYADLGSLHQELGDLDEARACYERSLHAYQNFGHRGFEGLAIGLLGDLERESGSLEESRTLYERAWHIAREVGDRKAEGRWLASLATTDAASGRLDAAAASFDAAEQLLRGDAFLVEAANVHRGHLDLGLARAAERRGDGQAAREHVETARRRLDSARFGERPFVGRSAYVRFASRLLERALETPRTPTQPPRATVASGRPAASSLPPAPAPAGSSSALVVSSTGRWFQLAGGERVSLQRRHALRLLLKRFLEHRTSEPGQALTLEALLETGWPGQRVHPQAGASRVYNALTELRKLGLRDVLISRDDGYLLDPNVAAERVEEPG